MPLWDALEPAITEGMIRFFEEEIPFNRVLGVKVHRLGLGACELRVPGRAELTGDPLRPALHGGVISALVDAAGGLAVFVHRGEAPLPRVSTVDLRVDYLQPGRPDRDVYALAEVRRVGNRVGVTAMVAHQGDPSQPIAEARGVYNLVRPPSGHGAGS